ncbi:radical SAM protein [Chitinophaga sp. 30R24]|uniref:radical SAM protein n=1 Tax=Chitinophaga sp. 30R24 TaxID=3248838 RepID=UPI003B90D3D0
MVVRQLVIKVASRCNLNCTYCYMYNMGDLSFKGQPKFMSDDTVDALLEKVKQHSDLHKLKYFDFVFHGGEPLLSDRKFFENFIIKAKKLLLPDTTPYFSLQTNAVLADEEWSLFFSKNEISIGVSLDGPKEANDKYRIDHAGNGSFDKIIVGLRKLLKHNQVGVLSVMNPEVKPSDLYSLLKKERPSSFEVLFPESNYDKPPFNNIHYLDDGETIYGNWLIELYQLWRDDNKDSRPYINIFNQIIRLILGYKEKGSESLGTRDNDVLVIESDGSIEPADTLKICGDSFTKVGLNVNKNLLDEAFKTELASLYYKSHTALCSKCQNCDINQVCGGGMLAHRYSRENDFQNPSIYCKDLMKLITFIQNDIVRILPYKVRVESGIDLLTYEDVVNR